MKTVLTIFIMTWFCLLANAQKVWTEGTTWEIYIGSGNSDEAQTDVCIYELGEPVSFNDTIYYTLTETRNGETNVISYIRSEGDDAYVYARQFHSVEFDIDTGDDSEILLYDFSKPFEYGDVIRYGIYGGEIAESYIIPSSEIKFFYDVIEPGDCLPAFNEIIYKIGSAYGPVAMLMSRYNIIAGGSPNSKNVSHILFKTKGNPNGSEITITLPTDIVVPDANSQTYSCFSLTGIRYTNADNQFLFKKDNILLKK